MLIMKWIYNFMDGVATSSGYCKIAKKLLDFISTTYAHKMNHA